MLCGNRISLFEKLVRRPTSNSSWGFFVLNEIFCAFPLIVQEHNASPNTRAVHYVKLCQPVQRR